jgi:iron complex outermembrane receptor protein
LSITLTGSAFDTTQNAVLLARGGTGVYLLSPLIPDPGRISDPYNSAYSTPGGAKSSTRSTSLRVQYDAPDVTLTSISAYQFTHDVNAEDGDSSPYDAFNYSGGDTSHAISQEFRVNSVSSGALSLGGHLTWVGGLYFFEENASEPYLFRLGSQSLFAFIAGPVFPPEGIINDVDRDLTTKSYAGFGQATYSITDRFDLTLGGRYSHDRKSVDAVGSTNLPGFPLIVAPFAVGNSDSWGKFTPRVTVDYKLTDRVMAYATWDQGYKSGAAQSVSFDPRLAGRLVNPETVNGYELGLKSELFDRSLRLNGALFYNKFKDLQVRSIVNLGSGVAEPAIENAANATVKGVELTATWIPVKNLSIDVGYNYLDAHYGTFIADAVAGSVQDNSGNTMSRSPKNTVNASARYDIPLPNSTSLAFSAATFYTSTQFFQPDDSAMVRQGGYTTTDFSITYALSDGRLQFIGWVKNAFDKEYETYAEEDAPETRESWADKRTVGVTARYRY